MPQFYIGWRALSSERETKNACEIALPLIRHWRIVRATIVIVETTAFTRRVLALLSGEEYRRQQVALANRPESGVLIKGGAGLHVAQIVKDEYP
jgi:hypothetical protein